MEWIHLKKLYPLNLLFKNSYYPIFGAFVQGNLGKFIKLSWINQSFMQDERRRNYKYILILMPKATVDRTILWRMFLFLLFYARFHYGSRVVSGVIVKWCHKLQSNSFLWHPFPRDHSLTDIDWQSTFINFSLLIYDFKISFYL